ncbi:transmembrane protein 169 [Ornithorhynchus anatinus]|uniref:Transmembrane protein 169 n=1 Tax=Ornithorhynchus anatinus TaxID=9258 RepID=A0A6I8P5C0_ORNAN|nr:transmembrane protein 169 [Ornithorhynchus anatinus]
MARPGRLGGRREARADDHEPMPEEPTPGEGWGRPPGSPLEARGSPVAADGAATLARGTKRRRKKEESRPQSVIVYRSENQGPEEEEEQEGQEDGEPSREEEGARFLGNPSVDGARYVTLTGTVTRGRRKGQLVDIHVSLTDRELRQLSGAADPPGRPACPLGPDRGPHVLLWTVACLPVVFVLAFVVSFYYGTLTWYSVFLVYNEERAFWHKVSCCPCLVLCYPPLIVALAGSLGLYAALAQLAWSWGAWWRAARDLEKGFCGWLCGRLGLDRCAPYSVVELLDATGADTPAGPSPRPAAPPVETSAV